MRGNVAKDHKGERELLASRIVPPSALEYWIRLFWTFCPEIPSRPLARFQVVGDVATSDARAV